MSESKNKPSEIMRYGLAGYIVITFINVYFIRAFYLSLEKVLKESPKLVSGFDFKQFMSEYYIHQSDYLNFWLFSLTIVLAIIGILSAVEFRAKIEEMDKKKKEMDEVIKCVEDKIKNHESKMVEMSESIEQAKSKMADDLKEVIEYVKKAEESKRISESYTWLNKSNQAILDKKFDKAIEYCTNAINLNTKNADIYCNRGHIYAFNKNEIQKAINDYTNAIELNSNFPEAIANRANAYMREKNIKEAREDYKRFIDLKPNYNAVDYDYTEAYITTGQFELALEHLNRFIEKESEPYIYIDDYEIWMSTLNQNKENAMANNLIDIINSKLAKVPRKYFIG